MKYYRQVLIALFGLILIAVALFPNTAHAKDFHIIDLEELSVDYKNYAAVNDKARDMLIYPEHPKEGVDLNMSTNLLKYFGWDSTVHSTTTGSQYRAVGLETRLYLRITEHLDIGYYHHSQHVLDRSSTYMERYPSVDAVQVKFYIFRARPGREALF